jgi:recombination protein RecA
MTDERYDKWHAYGDVKFHLSDFLPEQEQCRFLMLKVLEQAVRDYISMYNSSTQSEREAWEEARDFIFDDEYRFMWGNMELSTEEFLDILDIDIEYDPTATQDKAKALEIAIEAIKKSQGTGAIQTGSSHPDVVFVSSQSPSIDRALGGGWAKGRIVEVFGPESSGKTTLCLHAIAEVQKVGGKAAFVDAEHALDGEYATNLGVDMEELIISQPDNGEQALNVVETLTRSGALDLIVVDSVAALVPRVELEGAIGDSHMGLQSRMMGQAMRMLAGITFKTGTTIMFINQLRMKIGVMFGNPETTTGGNALKFYASQRVDVRRIGGVKQGDELIANQTKIKVVKNKVAKPFKIAEVEIRYGEGIDIVTDLLNLATEAGVVDKSGSWYSYGETKIGQGKEKAREFLLGNPQVLQEIKEKL